MHPTNLVSMEYADNDQEIIIFRTLIIALMEYADNDKKI